MKLSDYIILPKSNLLVSKKTKTQRFCSLDSKNSEIYSLYANLLTVEQYFDFIDLLIEGKTLDGDKKEIDPAECYNLAEDMLGIRGPVRTELLRVSEVKGFRPDKFNIEYKLRRQIPTINPAYCHNRGYYVSSSWAESEFVIFKIDSRGTKLWMNHHPFGELGIREIRRLESEKV